MRFAAILLLGALACGGGQQDRSTAAPSQDAVMTLAVENGTGGQVRVSTRNGYVGTIIKRYACVGFDEGDIPAENGSFRIMFKPIGERSFTGVITSRDHQGWMLRLSAWPNQRDLDLLSLQPSRRCVPDE